MDDNSQASPDRADIPDTESTADPVPAIDLPARYQFFYNDISTQSGRQYIFARAFWFMGTVSTAALSVIEWFV